MDILKKVYLIQKSLYIDKIIVIQQFRDVINEEPSIAL